MDGNILDTIKATITQNDDYLNGARAKCLRKETPIESLVADADKWSVELDAAYKAISEAREAAANRRTALAYLHAELRNRSESNLLQKIPEEVLSLIFEFGTFGCQISHLSRSDLPVPSYGAYWSTRRSYAYSTRLPEEDEVVVINPSFLNAISQTCRTFHELAQSHAALWTYSCLPHICKHPAPSKSEGISKRVKAIKHSLQSAKNFPSSISVDLRSSSSSNYYQPLWGGSMTPPIGSQMSPAARHFKSLTETLLLNRDKVIYLCIRSDPFPGGGALLRSLLFQLNLESFVFIESSHSLRGTPLPATQPLAAAEGETETPCEPARLYINVIQAMPLDCVSGVRLKRLRLEGSGVASTDLRRLLTEAVGLEYLHLDVNVNPGVFSEEPVTLPELKELLLAGGRCLELGTRIVAPALRRLTLDDYDIDQMNGLDDFTAEETETRSAMLRDLINRCWTDFPELISILLTLEVKDKITALPRHCHAISIPPESMKHADVLDGLLEVTKDHDKPFLLELKFRLSTSAIPAGGHYIAGACRQALTKLLTERPHVIVRYNLSGHWDASIVVNLVPLFKKFPRQLYADSSFPPLRDADRWIAEIQKEARADEKGKGKENEEPEENDPPIAGDPTSPKPWPLYSSYLNTSIVEPRFHLQVPTFRSRGPSSTSPTDGYNQGTWFPTVFVV